MEESPSANANILTFSNFRGIDALRFAVNEPRKQNMHAAEWARWFLFMPYAKYDRYEDCLHKPVT